MAIPVFDGHNDVLLHDRSFDDVSDEGHLDLARARAGVFGVVRRVELFGPAFRIVR